MGKQIRRDLRSLLHVPQHDLQADLDGRLGRLGFPTLRASHTQVLAKIGAHGVRLPELVAALGLPKQTVGDLIDDLEAMALVERVADPDHGVIKRVQLGAKGKLWAAEVKKVATLAETRWATRLGRSKMRSLRALLEELATTVESTQSVAPLVAKRTKKR